jgi:branched-chain amino acid transport system permease protein
MPTNPAPHIVHPRLPVWLINLGISLLIVLMYPLNWLMTEHMDPYFLRVVVLIGLNIILATSLNLINGITGQFSLGHAGFMAIGAYAAGGLLKYHGAGAATSPFVFLPALVIGGLLAALMGLIVGIPTLRLRGDYLAVATLGFGEIIFTIIINTDQIGPIQVGGSSGLHGIPILSNFFWVYLWVIVCVVAVWRLAYSAKGLAFRAVREDEIAAAAMGVDVTYHKVAAFIIGAFFAGVAGGLFATLDGDVAPESYRFIRSFEVVVMVVLGGSGSITGAILAAGLLTYIPEQFRAFAKWRMVVYSLVLIVMMLLRPEGLLGSREIWFRRKARPA